MHYPPDSSLLPSPSSFTHKTWIVSNLSAPKCQSLLLFDSHGMGGSHPATKDAPETLPFSSLTDFQPSQQPHKSYPSTSGKFDLDPVGARKFLQPQKELVWIQSQSWWGDGTVQHKQTLGTCLKLVSSFWKVPAKQNQFLREWEKHLTFIQTVLSKVGN